jgi:transcription elongation factor Elf1
MFPIKADSASAKFIMLVFSCPDPECGHESVEPLSRFHGRYALSCRECGASIDLTTKKHRVILEELAELCARADARFQEFD